MYAAPDLTRSTLCLACKSIFSGKTTRNENGEVLHHGLEALAARAGRGCHLCLTVYTSIDPEVLKYFQSPTNTVEDVQGYAWLCPIARDQARLKFRYVRANGSVIDPTDRRKPENGLNTKPKMHTPASSVSSPGRRKTLTPANSTPDLRDIRRFQAPPSLTPDLLDKRKMYTPVNSTPDLLDRRKTETPASTDSSKNSLFSNYQNLREVPITVELILMNPRYVVEPGVRNIDVLSVRTDSEDSFDIAKYWIAECYYNHMKCNMSNRSNTWKPTHLLDVSVKGAKGVQGIKLVDGIFIDPSSDYVTLSHCWGKAKTVQLHKGTLSALRQGVAASGLPKTFAEAAMVTEKLGYRYLWIDALCIMHDNESLVLKEISQMDEIYSEAALNIAATASRDNHGGLIYSRNVQGLQPVTVAVDGIGIENGLYKILRSATWHDLVDSSPLSKRAWVLQERCLAKRTLHFTRNELLWECHQMCCSEVFPKGLPATIEAPSNQDSTEFFNKRIHHQRHGNWNQLVKMFCQGRTTYSSDKLLAISGLAKQYMSRNRMKQQDYLVGLWRPQMPQALLWRIDQGRRPLKYRAPSWTWASFDGDVTYPEPGQAIKETCIEIVDIKMRYKTDELGLVESGKIKVRGFMSRGVLQRTHEYWGRTACTIQCSKTQVEFATVYFDERLHKLAEVPGVLSEQVEVYLLPVVDMVDRVEGLILCSNLRKGEFRRMGVFEVSRYDQLNWDRFRSAMKGDPTMDNYEARLDHLNGFWFASDYTYTINIV